MAHKLILNFKQVVLFYFSLLLLKVDSYCVENNIRSSFCEWTPWSIGDPWTSCTVTCGGGTSTRSRKVCCHDDANKKWITTDCLRHCRLLNSGFYDYKTCSPICYHGIFHSNTPSAGGYCSCSSGYNGRCCQSDINECSSNPCLHGTCTDHINRYTCNCNPGYTGTNCHIDIDECGSNPCLHGTCTDHVNRYTCSCNPGYTGTNCDIDFDECQSTPCTYGNCTDLVNGYNCSCFPGFTGTNCGVDIDECKSSPCTFGNCTDLVNGYNCTYFPGHIGTYCGISIESKYEPNLALLGLLVLLVIPFLCLLVVAWRYNMKRKRKIEDETIVPTESQ